MSVEGSVALVTGGAKRVGRAIVLELASAGCDVAIHYRDSDAEAAQLATEVSALGRRAVTLEADLNDPTTWSGLVQQTVESLGGLDILINNASLFRTGESDTLEAFDPLRWEEMFRTNLLAPVALCRYAAEHLRAGGRGRVVNLGDVEADPPRPTALAYCTSKAALAAVTRGLARSLAPDVLVNGVAPGIAVFPDDYSPEQRDALTSLVPLQRAGTPEEVARLVRFLVESGDYLTGQIIPLDGGRSLR